VEEEIEAGVQFAESSPMPRPEDIQACVYAD